MPKVKSMLHIVGGTYYEYCAEPERRDLLGSGLRAAAAVSKLTQVKLHTFADGPSEKAIAANATAFQVPLSITSRNQCIRFEYSHPLATPIVVPSFGEIQRAKTIELVGDLVLCFGMLEGSAKVKAKRAVYDPQSPFNPRPFAESGSTAESLALVLNGREAVLLAGEKSGLIERAVKRLFKDSGASVIVVKRGTQGASVFTRSAMTVVPAYRTQHVWKLGSGDVFAGAFAYFWAVRGIDPRTAAKHASAAAATYCESHALPLGANFHQKIPASLTPLVPRARKTAPLVYLAGPFFTMAQRWLINEARRSLVQQGLRVFSPMHDVGYGSANEVAPADLKALRKSDAVFAITDGLDAGTIFEVGYANAKNIPIVAFVQNEPPGDLKMLEGSGCHICDDFTTAVYHTIWATMSS